MTLAETLQAELPVHFPEAAFTFSEFRGELSVDFDKRFIAAVCLYLKQEPKFLFTVCSDITAVDWARSKDRFSVVYNLFSMENRFRLRLRCTVDESDCAVETVSSVWRSANWQERETYDMYGITFTNHPDLRRMYMPEEFEHHPLRKDYPVMGNPGDLPLPQ